MTTVTGTSLQPALDILARGTEQGDVPGAVALVRYRGDVVMHVAFGAAMLEPELRPMALDSVFDLASLTKPLATTPVVLRLIEQGALALDDPLGRYLREVADRPVGQSTIAQLLTHVSGLPAWFHVYRHARTREGAVATIAGLPFSSLPGTQVEYSCLGFMLLGILAERLTGRQLDELAHEWVFAPLGLTTMGFRPEFPVERYAATERGNAYERGSTSPTDTPLTDWRTDYVPGTVHDGNAWYAMQGVSGNAGLFGTADDVGILGQMWLNGGEYGGVRILSPRSVAGAIVDLTPALPLGRGLGWQIARWAPPEDSAPRSYGSRLSHRSYGHTGFTGTSIWIDPDDDLVIVLLTNRVHPVVGDSTATIALRHRFHDAVASALKSP